MGQLLQQRGGIVLGGIDEDPPRRIPTGPFQGGTSSVKHWIAPLGQTVNDRHSSDRQAVLQFPQQGFDSASTQIAGSEIEGRLIAQHGMGRGEEALRFLGRLPDMLCKCSHTRYPLEPLALGWTESPLPFPPLER